MNVKRYITVLLIALLITTAVFGGVIIAKFMVTPFSAGQHGDALSPIVNDKVNILVVGMDKVAGNTDTIVVCSVDMKNTEISVVSVPRDTRVSVNGSNMKINAVYNYAKMKNLKDEELLINTVKETTGIKINYYAIIDTEAFCEIVDTLGGVKYDVPRDYDYDDPYQDLHIHIKKGMQVLKGEQAEGLVRYRYDYARADLERVEVQQNFIKELIKQKLRLEYLPKVPAVYKAISKNVISNIKVDDIVDYGKTVTGLSDEDIHTYTLPGTPQTISGTSYFIVNKEETKQLVREHFE